MRLDIPDDDLDLIIKALDHYHAYTVARNAEDARYQDLADRLKPVERKTTAEVKLAKRRVCGHEECPAVYPKPDWVIQFETLNVPTIPVNLPAVVHRGSLYVDRNLRTILTSQPEMKRVDIAPLLRIKQTLGGGNIVGKDIIEGRMPDHFCRSRPQDFSHSLVSIDGLSVDIDDPYAVWGFFHAVSVYGEGRSRRLMSMMLGSCSCRARWR
jgi:hypothetical protein